MGLGDCAASSASWRSRSAVATSAWRQTRFEFANATIGDLVASILYSIHQTRTLEKEESARERAKVREGERKAGGGRRTVCAAQGEEQKILRNRQKLGPSPTSQAFSPSSFSFVLTSMAALNSASGIDWPWIGGAGGRGERCEVGRTRGAHVNSSDTRFRDLAERAERKRANDS